jgi:hypothetical protein
MKIKTSELTGYALDWAVNQIEECCDDPCAPLFSTDWAQGGPIIEREMIELVPQSPALWEAMYRNQHIPHDGPTPLIAAMRCFVASRLRDEIEIPEELK